MLSVTEADNGGCDMLLSDLVCIWKNHISRVDLLAEYQVSVCKFLADKLFFLLYFIFIIILLRSLILRV